MADEIIVFGIHAVGKLLDLQPARVRGVYLHERRRDARLTRIAKRAEQLEKPIARLPVEQLDNLAHGGLHQGVVCRAMPNTPMSENELKVLLGDLAPPPLLLILDRIQDPQNLGAILRSADAAGVHAVVVPKDGAVGLTPAVRKVASGAVESVAFVRVVNLARTLGWLKERGVWLVGTAADARETIYDLDLTGPLGVVLGSEGRGLRRLTAKNCDFLARIPMHGVVESLNVSVSAGICLFEAQRQRSA